MPVPLALAHVMKLLMLSARQVPGLFRLYGSEGSSGGPVRERDSVWRLCGDHTRKLLGSRSTRVDKS